MKLIIGLGNPGKEYERTRHNAGFDVMDEIARMASASITQKKFKALVDKVNIGGQSVLLMKPQTYMNNSGEAVRAAMGSMFRVPFGKRPDLAAYLRAQRERGVEVLVSALDGENFFERGPLPTETILVIGSEGRGVSQAVRQTASHVYRLPMRGGAESLNASVAAGVLIYELYRGLIMNEV